MKTNTKHWASITAGILSLAGYASATSLGSEKYTYDFSGNIVEKSIDGKITKMTYDSSNRLTGRQAIGQSKETTAYDAAGRPIAMKDGTGQPTRSMSYGYGDKVLESKNDDTNAGFFYNAEGQLVGKNTDSGVATYTWDGNVLAADGGETYTNEVHTTGGIPVMAGDQNIVISDYLGNTLSQGGQQFASTAYGEGLEQGRFTGKSFVKELDSFVFQCRNYSPKTSRWSVLDPVGFPDGANGYAYAFDPLTQFDPMGTTIQLEYMGEDVSYACQSKDGPSDNYNFHKYGATGSWRALFAWAEYKYNNVIADSSSLKYDIEGQGVNNFPDITQDSVSVTPRLDISERTDGTLSYNPSFDFEDQSGVLKAGANIVATGMNTKTLTFVCYGGTGLKQTTISGFGITSSGATLNFAGSSEDAKVFGLGTFIFKEQ